ncbi:MAG: hypothetical protein ACK4YF_09400, partial [Exilispira sp.]
INNLIINYEKPIASHNFIIKEQFMKNIFFVFILIFLLSNFCHGQNKYNNYECGNILVIPLELDNINDSNFYLGSYRLLNIDSIELFIFFKVGSKVFLSIGPLLLKAFLNISFGFYIIKESFYNFFEDKWYKYELYDYYICFEPNFSIGYQIDKKFSFNIGIRYKFFIFFNYQFPEFKPFYIYTMFIYSI